MLRVAKEKPGGEHVDWRLGFSDRAGTSSADFAVMSGHVAQVFRDDDAWSDALQHLHRALVPHAVLAGLIDAGHSTIRWLPTGASRVAWSKT